MTDKLCKLEVDLDVVKLRYSKDRYYLDNLEDITKQLTIMTNYKVDIGDNGTKTLCTGSILRGRIRFKLGLIVPEEKAKKYKSWDIFGDIDVEEAIENQPELQGKLSYTSLVGCYTDEQECRIMEIIARFPALVIRLKKVDEVGKD